MVPFSQPEMADDPPEMLDGITGVAWLVQYLDDGPHCSNAVRKNRLITVKPYLIFG
ncbi:MAG: hypothetical protein JNK26_05395 [Candidatus Doudnabacteria bacterium]|nr:hypothetical protein [Candidatus Doudnabacteria bacterium]